MTDTISGLKTATLPTTDSLAHGLYEALCANFAKLVEGKEIFDSAGGPENLYDDVFLANLPEHLRAEYNCKTCRQFVNRYGRLVTLLPDGTQHSMWWSLEGVPAVFRRAIAMLRHMVENDFWVQSVFLSSKATLGHAKEGGFEHMHVNVPQYLPQVLSVQEVTAKKTEDFALLNNALTEFSRHHIEQALAILKSGELRRAEKHLEMLEWFQALKRKTDAEQKPRTRRNLIWIAAVKAPAGWCHIKNTVAGTVVESVKKGKSFDQIKNEYHTKMDPTQYQRPQAPATDGNIDAATKLVEKLGVERSLLRRPARPDEIPAIWSAKTVQVQINNGPFAKLKQSRINQSDQQFDLGTKSMTWHRFQKVIMPSLQSLEIYITGGNANFTGIVTAQHSDAPPIIRWDKPEQRNPFSWYVQAEGSEPGRWSLEGGRWYNVTKICQRPCHWHGEFTDFGEGAILLIEGAKDLRAEASMLFPEILIGALRPIRATIEEYSKTTPLAKMAGQTACGLMIDANVSKYGVTLKFKNSLSVGTVHIDRWE